jgi:hypothetical protein
MFNMTVLDITQLDGARLVAEYDSFIFNPDGTPTTEEQQEAAADGSMIRELVPGLLQLLGHIGALPPDNETDADSYLQGAAGVVVALARYAQSERLEAALGHDPSGVDFLRSLSIGELITSFEASLQQAFTGPATNQMFDIDTDETRAEFLDLAEFVALAKHTVDEELPSSDACMVLVGIGLAVDTMIRIARGRQGPAAVPEA